LLGSRSPGQCVAVRHSDDCYGKLCRRRNRDERESSGTSPSEISPLIRSRNRVS
jgi:hypothetical protein